MSNKAKSTIYHFHPKKGKGVVCVTCANKRMQDFWKARQLTDPKYRATNQYHATWLDEFGPYPGDPDKACKHFPEKEEAK